MWPQSLLTSFQSVAHITQDESAYYGPYNTLLNILFPPDSPYEIVPRYHRPLTAFNEGLDFVTLYVIQLQRRPVFFIEIKPPASLNLLSKREEADIQMRHRYADMIDTAIVPTFHGISAFGTRLGFYTCDQATRRIIPGKIPRNDRCRTDRTLGL